LPAEATLCIMLDLLSMTLPVHSLTVKTIVLFEGWHWFYHGDTASGGLGLGGTPVVPGCEGREWFGVWGGMVVALRRWLEELYVVRVDAAVLIDYVD